MRPRMTSTYEKNYPNFFSFSNYRYILLYLLLELFIIHITWQYQDNGICTSDQFLCKGGTCIPRNKKCDGASDCFYNTDEIYCNDEYTIYFDVYYNTEIKTNTILIEPSVENIDACAEYCLKEKSFTCGSFDYLNASKECRLSHIGSETNQTYEDDILHFKLVPVIVNGVATEERGVLSSPKWLYYNASDLGSTWSWTEVSLNEDIAVAYSSVFFLFFSLSSKADTSRTVSDMLIIKSGNDTVASTSDAFVLDELPSNLTVQSRRVTFDFYAADHKKAGYLAWYQASCDATITLPTTLISPNFPDTYPDNTRCEMRIYAPTEHVINVHINHLNLNHGVGNHVDSNQDDDDDVCFDTDTLTFSGDNSEDGESILCGFDHGYHENVRSSSTFMRIVFQSNGNRDDSGSGYNLSISFLAVCEENLERYRFGLITVLILFILLIIFFVMLLLKWRPKAKKPGNSLTSEMAMENAGDFHEDNSTNAQNL